MTTLGKEGEAAAALLDAGDDPASDATPSPPAVDGLDEILKWSVTGPAWQKDALRRLCSGPDLDAADEAELLDILKGSKPANPLSGQHIRQKAKAHRTVALKSIKDVEHVNALAAKQTLSFAEKGNLHNGYHRLSRLGSSDHDETVCMGSVLPEHRSRPDPRARSGAAVFPSSTAVVTEGLVSGDFFDRIAKGLALQEFAPQNARGGFSTPQQARVAGSGLANQLQAQS